MNATVHALPVDSEPRLPLDIQLAIVDACPDMRTRLMLVSTHKTLRKWGARLVLQPPSAHVRLYSGPAARSFFMFLLHTLAIALATVEPVGIWNLAILLANVPRLTSLTLYDPEEVLCRHPSLYDAFRRLRTLKTFQVHDAQVMAFKLVSEVASALEYVTIKPRHLHNTSRSLMLEVALGPHKYSLTHVGVTFANGLPGPHPVVFENVRELVVAVCICPGASYYMEAFPKAIYLHVGTSITMATKRDAFMERIRSQNLEAVRASHGGLVDPGDCWPSLKRVRGGLLDLYIFGNSCSVATLLIEGTIKSDWACVPVVVKSHHPAILRLSVTPSLPVDLWEKDWRMMCSVNYLVLQFVVDDQVDLESLTDTAIRAVGSFVHCKYVFLDFKATSDAAHSQLRHLNHPSLRCIVEDRQLGPFQLAVRSPSKTTYWRHCPDLGRKKESRWEVRHMAAKTNFQALYCFPKDHVTDDWV
uniref:Serine/threonine-protein phosphatase 2B catalytic subunit A1 ) n=1 Tax=Ganoderma boninense TaxID=34458 RepID=A0A5K1K5N8_9APHY|nr:Serine/threonine-protein phosphatase 2B catalytic subunit A1 (EC (Calcineurin A1) [Ganoderma boninense]